MSWTIKKAERWRINAFELCWRRLLRDPWTARKSNQSILKGINTEYSLEGLMLKLKLQYFGLLRWRADSLEKTLMLGKIKDRGWNGWMDPSLTQWTWTGANSRWWRGTGRPGMLQRGVAKSRAQLGDWTTATLTEARTLHDESKATKNRRHARKTNYAWDFPSVSAKNPTSQETPQTHLTSMAVHLWLGSPDKIQDNEICISDKQWETW